MNIKTAVQLLHDHLERKLWDLKNNYSRDHINNTRLNNKNTQLVANLNIAINSLFNSIEDQLIVDEKERNDERNLEEDFHEPKIERDGDL
jgi:hypothetical protein